MKYILEDKILKIEIASLFNEKVQDFFDEFIPSKKIQHLLIQNKWITLDGNPCKRDDFIVGMNLEINIYPELYEYHESKHKLDVVYEDEIILVVNKPKGVLVHSDGNDEDTLTEWVKAYFIDRPYVSAYPLHRLDKETSGLVMFSKSIIFQPLLDKLLSEKQIRRSYLAFVKGKMERNASMVINEPIGKDRHNANKRVVYKGGQSALTKVRSLGYSKKNDFSILRCILDTGRTHQIRVHLAYIGYPVHNDPVYSNKTCTDFGQFLHSAYLKFKHPITGEMLEFSSKLPEEFQSFIDNLL